MSILSNIFMGGTIQAHIAKGVVLDTKRLVYGMQGDNSTTRPGGAMEVAMSSLGLILNYVVWVLGNKGGGPDHMQGCHALDMYIGSRKLVVLTLNVHQIFN
jgi:hypothetical protein